MIKLKIINVVLRENLEAKNTSAVKKNKITEVVL